jgi:hypothetical protein
MIMHGAKEGTRGRLGWRSGAALWRFGCSGRRVCSRLWWHDINLGGFRTTAPLPSHRPQWGSSSETHHNSGLMITRPQTARFIASAQPRHRAESGVIVAFGVHYDR